MERMISMGLVAALFLRSEQTNKDRQTFFYVEWLFVERTNPA